MMPPLRAAVIGAGAMGAHHARVYTELESIESVAVADPDPAATAKLSRRHRVMTFPDIRSALREASPDVVSVAVPTGLHETAAVEAIDHGCHVLVEKPLALSLDSGRRIIDAARSSGVKLAVGHIERFNPAVAEMKARLARRDLGRVFQVHARRVSPFPGRVDDVGVILDLATHDIDVIRHLLDSDVERAFAETERNPKTGCEDLVTAVLRFSDGVVGVLDVNWLTPTKVRELAVLGEGGMYVADYLTQDLYWYKNASSDGGWDTLSAFRGAWEGDMVKIRLHKKEPLRAQLEAFVDAVVHDREPAVTGADGLAAVSIAMALVESGGRHVPISPQLVVDRP